MLGARSMADTAEGSRPKLKTDSTSAVNTMAESSAVRLRNSRRRSFFATSQACRHVSDMGHHPAVLDCDLGRRPLAPRRAGDEPARFEKSDVGREPGALFHVVGHQDRRAPFGGEPG